MANPAANPLLILLVLLLPGLALSCGHIRPAPQDFHAGDYVPVTIEQLQAPRPAGLVSGQKVRVTGYFWQYLDYDPRLAANYLTMARQPLAWSRLRWASLYRTLPMQGYYDRLALTQEQQRALRLKRLEKVEVYGELAPWGFGALYLQAHQIQRLEAEEGPAGQGQTAPEAEGQETPEL
jgi:hypothetical protein